VIRRLLWLAVIALIVWGARRLFASFKKGAGASSVRGAIPRAGDAMVRDRVCNTFLPRDRALIAEHDGATHYFCSESCRSRYLEERRAAS
jgi:YHS domain-containing protein